MSWLRSSPLRQSLTGSGGGGGGAGGAASGSSFFASGGATSTVTSSILRQRPIDTATDCDPRACYDSFCKHWQQAYDIIQRSELPHKPPTHDDVLGVVSHLDFMVTLLLVELHHCNKVALPSNDGAAPPAPCLEYMLSENLLDKLYEWGCTTGRYANAVRLEQLKLYELLVSHSRHQLLCHEPFLRPLLKILASSQGEIFPPDLEKRLVILLNQLCVVLMQNVHLLDLFFFSAAQEQSKQQDHNEPHKTPQTNFIIFSLLIPYVHREGSLGHQARDALLLCMALSQKNSNIGTYIAQYSSMCPLLVTGLGGLYSRLPNSIEITSIDWHRITPDDVTEISELTLFMNALEFCNAVVQVAHEMIKHQLLDFMYQGFIVPVLGPAILQTLKGKHFQTNVESQVSAMSYLDLILRSVTEPGLLRAFVHFLLDSEKFDGVRIIDVLIERISSPDANLCMVTMALFDTLLGLNCEDLMLELLLKYLLPGKHVPISHRHKINKIDPYTNSAEFFLELTPDVMKRVRDLTKHKHLGDTVTNNSNSNNTVGSGDGLLVQPPVPSPTSTMSKTIGANWNYYGLHSGESLYANLQAYLFEAHFRIAQCQSACAKWANTYKYQRWPPRTLRASALDAVRQFFAEFSVSPLSHPLAAGHGADDVGGDRKQLDSLQSISESSGYESFKWRLADEDGDAAADPTATTTTTMETNTSAELDNSNSSGGSGCGNGSYSVCSSNGKSGRAREWWRISNHRSDLLLTDLDFSEDLFAQGTVSLGPFLNAIWGKLQTFTSNTLYVNLHLTGLITHLAWYPLPLVHSLLLRPDIVITSDTPSFHQVLRILKQQIDAELPVIEDSLEIIDVARSYLIDREFRLLNVRKASENSPLHTVKNGSGAAQRGGQQQPPSAYASISATSPVQVTPSSSYDPFKRNDTKRKSISKSITSMFSRKPNGNSSSSPFGSGSSNAATANSPASSTHETSLTTLPNVAGNPTTAATTKQQSTQSPSYMSSGHSSLSSNASHSLSSISNASVSTNNTALSSTLSAASTVATLLGSQNGASGVGGGGGGGSEPVSLESLGSMGAIANTSGTERTRDLALCAVLLDEWLKELAAIAQEQSVVLVSECL